MTKTKKMLEQVALLRKRAAEQMEIDYPIGTDVSWDHGDYLRRGQIESYGYGLMIFVRTPTGKRVGMEITKVWE